MQRILTIVVVLFLFKNVNAQLDPPPALEGGKGSVQSQSADLYGTGFLGLNFTTIYNSKDIPGQGREHLVVGLSSLTYDVSDEMQISGVLYAIGKGLIYASDNQPDRFQDGFGAARFALKYRMPFKTDAMSIAARLAFHVPLGANFAIHPSYPYDTDVYSVEINLLETIHFTKGLRLHLNEGYRWQGIRESKSNYDDLLLTSAVLDYTLAKNWYAYSEFSSALEMDSNIQPLQDRFVFSQGIQYVTPWSIGLNLGANFRLSEDRKDGTPNRAEDWRIIFGISFTKRTFTPDDDNDGVPNDRDVQLNTPKGWPVDKEGKALDSDSDRIPDAMDKESNTPLGAKVDLQGRALDSDKDGIPDGIDKEDQTPKGAVVDQTGRSKDSDGDGVLDGIDKEPNTATGAKVDVNGVSIDSDGDGVPDGIDIEPATPAGKRVDSKGKALSDMEADFIKNGLLRVNKIFFDVGKATIKPESYAILDEISRMLDKYPQLNVQISGHTDSDGSSELNMRLSLERATSVKSYILGKSSTLNDSNLIAKGFGSTQPVSTNQTQEGKTLNRRVEFVVLNPEVLN